MTERGQDAAQSLMLRETREAPQAVARMLAENAGLVSRSRPPAAREARRHSR